MKRVFSLSAVILGSALIGFGTPAFAGRQDSHAGKEWRWEQIEPLFPHALGTRWVYAVSGKWYANGGELRAEVRGTQHVLHLKKDAVLIDETHPGVALGTPSEVLPVLYYASEGYLVRDTAYIYSNPQRTSLISTGNLGEAVAPILPLDLKKGGTDWQPVDEEQWGKASRLDVTSHFRSEQEMVAVKAGTYPECVKVEGTVARGDGSGYRYQEWYAPGVGLVKSTTTDLLNGEVLLHKELVSFHVGPSSH